MSPVNVVIVGCGVPNRGMGWYHAKNILDGEVPGAVLTDIVEPYFLGPGKESPPGKIFAEFASAYPSVAFHDSVDKLPARDKPFMAIISGRTVDNPALLQAVIKAGCSHVYLEKPGAGSVEALEGMIKVATDAGVPVFMGYNKNVTKYVTDAREFEAKTPGAMTTFTHSNAYKEEELPECFERNAEGMLKNMAVHECALLVTFYGVTASNIESCVADKEFSRKLTLIGPSGKEFTDFAAIGFTLKTTEGKQVAVKATRTGGGFSRAEVSVDGNILFTSKTPDEQLQKEVDEALKANPELMPYFPLQHADYVELKSRACKHILSGQPGVPSGMASIEIAAETLRVAEKLYDELNKQL